MENMNNFWQLGDDLRGQAKVAEDHKWLMAASKLAEQTRTKGERMNNLDLSKGPAETRTRDKFGFQEENKFENLNFNMMNLDSQIGDNLSKSSFRNGVYNMNAVYLKNKSISLGNPSGNKYFGNNHSNKDVNSNSNENSNANNGVDKRFKTLPATETLPRDEVLGGYIFVCNNDTMQEDLKRQLFGLPPRYRDSVRAIKPGLPLFLYNYTTHQLHGIFEAASFGGSNIDPTAWEDKKIKGESRFPAQVKFVFIVCINCIVYFHGKLHQFLPLLILSLISRSESVLGKSAKHWKRILLGQSCTTMMVPSSVLSSQCLRPWIY